MAGTSNNIHIRKGDDQRMIRDCSGFPVTRDLIVLFIGTSSSLSTKITGGFSKNWMFRRY